MRLYADSTNDLSGASAGGFVALSVTNTGTPGEFMIRFENTSDTTVYPGVLTPLVWTLHAIRVTVTPDG